MSLAMEDWPRRHRITVHEYHRMAEAGLLAPDARVKLIEGEIIDMPPIGSRHAAAVSRLARLLERAMGDRAIVRCQLPIQLGELSEPQPDLALFAPREDCYDSRHPVAAEARLVIEVSDTTLRYDQQTKMPLYARHGVGSWIQKGSACTATANHSAQRTSKCFLRQRRAFCQLPHYPAWRWT